MKKSPFILVLAICSPLTVLAAHSGRSPFDPPKPTDTTFVVDQGQAGLDTDCRFRSGGPLVFSIEVTRFVGEIKEDGTLKAPADLIAKGVVSKTATLQMPGGDVDYDTPHPPNQSERDQVLFNGRDIGFLRGLDDTWIQNSFDIPIELIKFPARAALGSAPTPAINTITINIDTANNHDVWCTELDWASLSFKAVSLIILIHGNNSNGAFFDRQGFTSVLQEKKIPFDNSINLETTTVQENGKELDTLIPKIAKSFGVDSIHLIAHSKGGLDSREYLANYQPEHDKDFKVLSYTSLSTPHNGSVGADLLVKRDEAVKITAEIEFKGDFPSFTETVLKSVSRDDGTPDLQTTATASFNDSNIRSLPKNIVFNTVAADADQNSNGRIDQTPHEYVELLQENLPLAEADKHVTGSIGRTDAQVALDATYRLLRHTASVTLTYHTVALSEETGLATKTIATVARVPTLEPQDNDVLVTVSSGQGIGSMASLTKNTQTFTGAQGRNHSSIANAGVAETVVPWIIQVEQTLGDLK